jgi:hypothetical protein
MSAVWTVKVDVKCDHEYNAWEFDDAAKMSDALTQDFLTGLNDLLPDGWTAEEAK